MKQILQTLKSTDYLENIKILLGSELCSPRLRVEFALMCVKDELQYLDANKEPKKYETSKKCIELVEKWLVEPEAVTKEELKEAAYSAANIVYHAAYAAYYAAYYAINAANAAYYAAYYATNAASAVNAAYWAVNGNSKKLKQYYEWLFEKLTESLNKETIRVLYGE